MEQIKNKYTGTWHSPVYRMPKSIGMYICYIHYSGIGSFEILRFNGEYFCRAGEQPVNVLYWTKLKKPHINYNSNNLESPVTLVCSECGLACDNIKNKEGRVSTFYKGICNVCEKETMVTQTRDYGFPDFTERRKQLGFIS